MVRNSIAAVLGCLYVAGSVWLVRSAGESYRKSLHPDRVAAVRTEPKSLRQSEEVAKAAPTVAAPVPPSTHTEPAQARPNTTVAASPPIAENGPPAPRGTGLAAAKPAIPAPATPAPGPTAGDIPGPTNQPPKFDPVLDQPHVKLTWDLAHLRTEDEIHLGRQLHDVIVQLNRTLETGPWQRRVEEAAEPFLKTRSRKDIPYTFTILDSEAVNAFSHPGGFVYVSRGLFNLIGEDEDYALEFVIGHEIAHVDLGHALKCLRAPEVLGLKEGTLQKLYLMIIPFAYLDREEYEADRWVYRQMRQLGRTERECLAFLRKLEGHARTHGFENGRGKPEPGRDSSLLDNHLRAHTAAWKRLKQLKEPMGHPANPPK